MGHLLSKLYKNRKAKTKANAEVGKKLSNEQKVQDNNEKSKEVVKEDVKVMKESKTLMFD